MKKDIVTTSNRGIVDPKMVQAMNTIMTGEVPASAKKKHPGKGGKTFTYLSHVWVTRTLQQGLQNQWSFEVLDWQVFDEELDIRVGNTIEKQRNVNVVARTKFTLYVIVDPELRQFPGDPIMYERVVTEVGIFEKPLSMPTSTAIASAVSRGLCRCVMRALGIGLELYEADDPEPTPAQAWTSLKQFAINQGTDWNKAFEDALITRLKDSDITSDNLVDKYSEAYNILASMLGKVVSLEEMPK